MLQFYPGDEVTFCGMPCFVLDTGPCGIICENSGPSLLIAAKNATLHSPFGDTDRFDTGAAFTMLLDWYRETLHADIERGGHAATAVYMRGITIRDGTAAAHELYAPVSLMTLDEYKRYRGLLPARTEAEWLADADVNGRAFAAAPNGEYTAENACSGLALRPVMAVSTTYFNL